MWIKRGEIESHEPDREFGVHALDCCCTTWGSDLSDTFPQGDATQQKWRTAPLWDLGLLASINPNVRNLHDGRARSIEEAILWHGGQAAAARDRFKALSADERQKVIDMASSR